MGKVRAVVCEAGEYPVIREIENDLETLQSLVGGFIRMVPMDEDHHMWVNEEGLLDPHPQINMFGSALTGRAIVGTVVILGSDGHGGEADAPMAKLFT